MLNHKKRRKQTLSMNLHNTQPDNKQTQSRQHVATSTQEMERRKSKSSQPPQITSSHFFPLLHQGAPHPSIPSASITPHSSPTNTAPCTAPRSSPTTTSLCTAPSAPHPSQLSITCRKDNRPSEREVQLHLSKYEHTHASRCAKL
jgi:hypothetical protein